MSKLRRIPMREEHRYHVVLVLILATLVFLLAAPDEEWARCVTIVLQGLTLLVALWTSGFHQVGFRIASVFVTLAVLGALAATLGDSTFGSTPGRTESLMLVALAPIGIATGIVKDFRAAGRVTVNAMFGVLCIYLLIGMFFGFAFGVDDRVDSGTFFASGVSEPSDFQYFSFSTLTTVGYGDLVASTSVGRSLAIAEALIGQIYMVTVVAVIVGNLGRGRPRDRA